eukprot:jgi/Galph1/5419/GphlegSOOS_G4062.1
MSNPRERENDQKMLPRDRPIGFVVVIGYDRSSGISRIHRSYGLRKHNGYIDNASFSDKDEESVPFESDESVPRNDKKPNLFNEQIKNISELTEKMEPMFKLPNKPNQTFKKVVFDPILFKEPSFLKSRVYEDFIVESELTRKRNHFESMDSESLMHMFESAREGWLACPQCKGLAPPEEIKKWGWCSYCHAEIDLKRSPAEILFGQGANDDVSKEEDATEEMNDSLIKANKRDKLSGRKRWNVRCSLRAARTVNPIRELVQGMSVRPNPEKKLIQLSVGDPTVFGNLKVPREAVETLSQIILNQSENSYSNSLGQEAARQAIAERFSSRHHSLTKDNVILTCGASGALELIFSALCNEGDNVLVPRPGFPLFKTLLENLGVQVRYYDLDPYHQWQAQVEQLVHLVDHRTVALVVNNPSNPCGSVYSYSHMMEILQVAQRLCLPIVADEVYAYMTFPKSAFFSFGDLSEHVPVLSVGSISKMFVAPGWRVGWIIIHDRNSILERAQVLEGLKKLTMRMIVPSSPFQAILPTLFSDACQSQFKALMETLHDHATYTVESLSDVQGLQIVSKPQGSMYCMVKIDTKTLNVKDDVDFASRLLEEESVFVLPGQCFQALNYFRLVYCAPKTILNEAFSRIRYFCRRYSI